MIPTASVMSRIEVPANFLEKVQSSSVDLRHVFRSGTKRLIEDRYAAPVLSEIRKIENEIVPASPLRRQGLQSDERLIERWRQKREIVSGDTVAHGWHIAAIGCTSEFFAAKSSVRFHDDREIRRREAPG